MVVSDTNKCAGLDYALFFMTFITFFNLEPREQTRTEENHEGHGEAKI